MHEASDKNVRAAWIEITLLLKVMVIHLFLLFMHYRQIFESVLIIYFWASKDFGDTKIYSIWTISTRCTPL